MGEIVLSNKQTTKSDGELVSAEERADYLIKNDYPLPTDDYEELVAMIQKNMDETAKQKKEQALENITTSK